MNKQLRGCLFIAIMIVIVGMLHGHTVFADDGTTKAVSTVGSYLYSLVHGDISGMKAMLSPKLLHEKTPILDSSSYSAILRLLYPGAYKILNAAPSGSERIRVDATLTLYNGELMKASFLVLNNADDGYLIDEEIE
jgi:hypothetical protein